MKKESIRTLFSLHMERDLKGVVVNEAPVGLQSHAPTKPLRELSPVSRLQPVSKYSASNRFANFASYSAQNRIRSRLGYLLSCFSH